MEEYDLFILDSGPFGLVTHPKDSKDALICKAWLRSALASGFRVMVPEVVEYEVRRELARAGRPASVARCDALAEELGTLATDRRTWHLAAELWAEARRIGKPMAPDLALDADVIVATIARLAAEDGSRVIVVTGNPGHLSRFADARDWRELAAEFDVSGAGP